MKTKRTNKILVLVISLMMIVTLLAGLSITASAEETGTETNTPVAEFVGKQVNLGGDISMKFYVRNNEDRPIESITVEVEFLGKLTYLTECEEHPTDAKVYIYTFEGVGPQCLGDLMNVTILVGGSPVGHEKAILTGYSVEKNLLNLLEKYKDDAALVALINDTLAYGKAASEYKKHDTMTGDYTVSDSTIPDATVTPNGAFTGYTVVFGQVNFIKVSVELADGYTLYLDGTNITSQLVGGIFKTDGIAPTEFEKKFSFEIKNGDTTVQTFAVSVNDYIGAQKDSTTMGNLVKALYNYGVSAKVYNHVKTGEGEHYYVDGVCACGAKETIDATAMTADELKAAVAEKLVAGRTDIEITLNPDAPAEMITAIRRAICDTEGVADGSIHLTLRGVTSIPGTTNWDGVAFGACDTYDEDGKLVDQEYLTQLASVNLPDVTSIGDQAFYGCSNLTSIIAPNAQIIGRSGFDGTGITSIDMPLLKEVGYAAFFRSALTEVYLPSLEIVGNDAFRRCEQLQTVDLPKLQTLSKQLFQGCAKLESITLGSVVTEVNENLFGGEALSSGIALTLHPDQANAEGTLKATAGTNVAWAGFTWKEVKFSATE